jgi:hypothetical protein
VHLAGHRQGVERNARNQALQGAHAYSAWMALRADQLLVPPTLDTGARRSAYAKRFAAQLHQALAARRLRPFQVAKESGGLFSHRTVDQWLRGLGLPRLDAAVVLADVLSWPMLATITREARTSTCQRIGCSQTFISQGKPRMYCGPVCAGLAQSYGVGHAHARRKTLGGAEAVLHMEAAQGRAAAEERDELRRAVAAFCDSCEPEGVCRQPNCPLRVVSPLPLSRVSRV